MRLFLQRFNRYITHHFSSIIVTILVAIISVFYVLPKVGRLSVLNKLTSKFSTQTYISLIALLLLILIVAWKKTQSLWQRYRNSWQLKIPSFSYIDHILWFAFSCVLLILLYKPPFVLALSSEFKSFSIFSITVILIWFLIAWFWPSKEQDAFHKYIGLSLSDEPIETTEQDLFERGGFVEDLYRQIVNLPFSDSFVFGIYGSWGEGKTSIINLLNKRFRENATFLVLNFDPWNFYDETTILPAFYNQVDTLISGKYILPNFRRTLAKYKKMTSPQIDAGIKLELPIAEENLDEVKARIESHLMRIQKKIIIFIDDIDRLQDKEILLVLKLVRLNAKFRNTVFILSLDYGATVDKINVATQGRGKEYLEKIIQKPIILPKVEPLRLNKILFYSDHPIPEFQVSELLNLSEAEKSISTYGVIQEVDRDSLRISDENDISKILLIKIQGRGNLFQQLNLQQKEKIFIEGNLNNGKLTVTFNGREIVKFRLSWMDSLFLELLKEKKVNLADIKEFDERFEHFYRSSLSRLFQDLRDVKRFMNSIYSSLPAITEEVNITDFCLLEIIKLYYIEIYNDIYENWYFYVEQRAEADIFTNPLGLRAAIRQDNVLQLRREHISATIEKYVAEPYKREIINEILKMLFPNILGGYEVVTGQSGREKRRLNTTSFIKSLSLN